MQKQDVMKNYQAIATKQGYLVEDIADIRFGDAGFEIADKRVQLESVEIDRIYTNKHGISFFTTIKGSFRGDRPGCIRTDTLKKAIAEALFIKLEGWGPVLLATSHVPQKGRGAKMLEIIDREILFGVVDLFNGREYLEWLANATEEELRNDLYK